ncbi:MAG TPA: hypothetical protein VMW07_05485 [Gallionella sp.]|nr:hypothetical protein [Gallionella sp.]
MKKLSKKQRLLDVKTAILHRHKEKEKDNKKNASSSNKRWVGRNDEIDVLINKGLSISLSKNRDLTINLPEEMNFSKKYDETILYIIAIRRLAATIANPYKAYRLKSVNFNRLKKISTSAALVLTAELSKWDDATRQRLRPMTDNWDADILKKFIDLGFFDLFKTPPNISSNNSPSTLPRSDLVRYIKGRCGEAKKTRELKDELIKIVGDPIDKWMFLRGGLDEAITNVSHHAYPDNGMISENNKNWYLTGSYNGSSKELKIVFYDQGIGIPKSLPASKIWERALEVLSLFPAGERKLDEVLLKAAVELDRTSTNKSDRGKGLQDMLEFIRQRREGYLSILSSRGLYKLSVSNGKELVKSEHFDDPISGTLIIWSATLQN